MPKDKRPGYLGSSVPDAEKAKRPRQRGAENPDLDRIKAELDRLNELLTKKNRDDLDAMYNIGWDQLSEDMHGLLSSYEDGIRSAEASIQTWADEMSAGFAAVAEFETEISDALAEFRAEVTEDYATISMLTSFETEVSASIAEFREEVGQDYATISMLASVTDANGNVNAASIVAAVNDAGSSVMIDADKIQMTGTTTFLTEDDVGDGGSTEIAGNRISMNLDASEDLDNEFTESDNGLNFFYVPDYYGNPGTVARIYTAIDGNLTDTTSRYSLNIETREFRSRRNETVYPSIKVDAAGRVSIESEEAVYIGATLPATHPYILLDGYQSTRVRAYQSGSDIYSASTAYPDATDYVFCTDGIYYNGVRILST